MVIVISQSKLLLVCGCGTKIMEVLLERFTNTFEW